MTNSVIDGCSSLAVAFYVLNMLQNMHSRDDFGLCTSTRCYVMLIPGFIRTAALLVGSEDRTEDYLFICHVLLQRHRCVEKHDACIEAIFAAQQLFTSGINWIFPKELTTVMELQDALNL